LNKRKTARSMPTNWERRGGTKDYEKVGLHKAVSVRPANAGTLKRKGLRKKKRGMTRPDRLRLMTIFSFSYLKRSWEINMGKSVY